MLTHICEMQENGTVEPICKTKNRDIHREQMYGHQGGKGRWNASGDWD